MTLTQTKQVNKFQKAIGNVFNAQRDNHGKGIKVENLIAKP